MSLTEVHLRGKEYYWHIPKKLRWVNIQKGDLVKVCGGKNVIVIDVFRENIEETGKSYKEVLAKIVRKKRSTPTKSNKVEINNTSADSTPTQEQ